MGLFLLASCEGRSARTESPSTGASWISLLLAGGKRGLQAERVISPNLPPACLLTTFSRTVRSLWPTISAPRLKASPSSPSFSRNL